MPDARIEIISADPRNAAHLDALTRLFRAYCAHYETEPAETEIRRFLSARLLANESVAFLARLDDDFAGFVHLYPKYASTTLSRYWILNDLFVDEAHRRRGVAHALMGAAERFSEATGSSVLTLKTHTSNTPAQALYEARGWQRADDFLTYNRSNA